MAKSDIRHYSRDDIKAMKKRGKVRATPANVPEIDPDNQFWKEAHIVKTQRISLPPES